ncbi:MULTISPECIES: NADH-quinone oxidoreductase subunit L [unclassified Sphingobium]|uniref:NADH-quinone oxidoreductase subunit L n=1 Tax=unclassified Sphingobium TaxID=2611147 RepID=UPI000D158622|nr:MULTISPECIES: NADH-quinone oxidoreductase subunit L [unclassified Sphingobium]MBG6117007.1 NADH-quinone oxidoreductase subunit L [Sphingobium sp. JAI105]PSO11428.1 NADH-quinone oxidoreductase subunit L [Sphingobium sp. AEW4]TWD12785.1 NADH dehydrogenase subunit L [Sphingobium sp. AEW010]TWD30556.1 NADH dehydrogenase subunit L [Sphingobium sp. AEW013]TWD30689.1 NADH dehydrogenase subunit L [Sphingobium sp. AEW001]
MIQLIVLLPLLAAAIAGLGNKALGKLPAKIVTTGALFASCAMSWPIFISFLTGSAEAHVTPLFTWIQSGSFDAQWALRVDAMTAVMLVVITSVSSLVHLYSWGYMEEEPDQPRFFAYLSLFTFAMLMLVTANNLLQMFFGWEGVGLASYLLIGFWFRKPSANAAAIKAFVVNRVGDLGFMMGIFGTYLVFNTISIPEILEMAPSMAGSTIGFLGHRFDTMTVLCLLLFVGAMGKSAQLGLHTWLPDAMEGPTPVSALIHAATMVTAGVFMVCRLSPMFETSATALTVVTYVGAATCLFAATVGTVQTDIKRVIAYSTCSQLGYMFFAAGVGAYGAAMFHLFTHAFFKALLFLGAGSVIHAMHHEQDMRYYGGLRKSIPITFWTMTLGTLAITGVGLPLIGVGFAGFYSKDGILEAAYAAGGAGTGVFIVGVLAALLTSFYSWRLVFLTFFGKPRWTQSEHIQHALHDAHGHDDHATHGHGSEHDNAPAQEDAGHDPHAAEAGAHELPAGTGGYHPHESPLVMLIPLIMLSLGAVFAGFLFHDQFIGAEGGIEFWKGALSFDSHLMHAAHEVPTWVKFSPFTVMLTGLLIAYLSYIRNTDWPQRFVATFGGLYTFLLNKWYFDELYTFLFVKPAFAIGRFFWKFGDIGFIDRFGPNGLAALVVQGNKVTRRLQSGYLYTYALVMLIGLAAAATWAMTR